MDNRQWTILNIEGNKLDREIATAFLEDMCCGIYSFENKSHIYFDNPDKKEIENIVKSKTNINSIVWDKIKNKDWNEKWKPFFKDINIDNKVFVIPSWKEKNVSKDKILIKIEPGMAFGTGHHETTAMMIKSLLDFYKKGMSVMDVGTGSGILAILSQKLGCSNIFTLDNDPDIQNNFNDNLNLNNCNIDIKIGDCLNIENFNYDIILANINLSVLKQFIRKVASHNNILILSGLLITDISNIKKEINDKKFTILKEYKQNEWACLVLRT